MTALWLAGLDREVKLRGRGSGRWGGRRGGVGEGGSERREGESECDERRVGE